ncbi:MAG: hypothetical protein ACRDKT_05770 [Actinomycetota bacterium]
MASMRRSNNAWRQRAAVFCLLLFALSLWAPPAWTQTAPERANTSTALEAWYYVADDSYEPPAPLPVVPDPVNPYGENTLHVGITGGQEDTRTYIALDVEDLPVTFELIDGTLILPIAESNGTINAEDSRVSVCLATLPPKAEEGSFEEPPEVDCKTKSPATYRGKPFPHLKAELKPFEEDLAFSALAIMPSERAVEKQDTWHVAFYAKKNKEEEAKPIEATLSYVEEDVTGPVIDSPDIGSAPVSGSGGFDVGDVGGFDSGGAPEIGGGEVDTGEPAPASTAVVAQPQTQPVGDIRPGYNIVWSLPLVLLALYFYFGSALTREIVIRFDR